MGRDVKIVPQKGFVVKRYGESGERKRTLSLARLAEYGEFLENRELSPIYLKE